MGSAAPPPEHRRRCVETELRASAVATEIRVRCTGERFHKGRCAWMGKPFRQRRANGTTP